MQYGKLVPHCQFPVHEDEEFWHILCEPVTLVSAHIFPEEHSASALHGCIHLLFSHFEWTVPHCQSALHETAGTLHTLTPPSIFALHEVFPPGTVMHSMSDEHGLPQMPPVQVFSTLPH